MPRSTNPSNYEEVYWDLLHGMRQEIAEIKLNLTANAAQKVKFTFYAFIRALEVTSEHKRKRGDMTGAGELTEFADAMRKYLVDIEINGESVTQIKARDQTSCILRFINRDLNPKTASMRDQVKEQLSLLGAPASHIHEPIVAPPVASFFDKPLEIHSDGKQDTKRGASDGGNPTNEPAD